MRTNIQVLSTTINAGTLDFSRNLNYAINQSIAIFNSQKNALVKSIGFRDQISDFGPSIIYSDFRMRMHNRDGSIITENGGNIINPVSGAWGGLTKNTDLDIILSSRKNFIEFKKGVEIGGFQPISFSILLPNPSLINFTYSIFIDVDYE